MNILANTLPYQIAIWGEEILRVLQQTQKELLAAGLLILAIAIHYSLGWLWRKSLGEKTILLLSDESSEDYQSGESFLNFRLLLTRIILWLTVAVYIINLFPVTQQWLNSITNNSIARLIATLLFILFSLIVGQYTPSIIKLVIQQIFFQKGVDIYQNLIVPVSHLLRIASTLVFISFALSSIKTYPIIYEFFRFFIDLSVTISVAWLASRIFRQFVRFYGIDLIRKLGREVDEIVLVFETLANLIIGFIAVVAFAQSRFDLIGLLAGLGIGGLAVAFAAQKTLEQLLGTVVLYLDRPFIPGEYIRLPDGSLGRVESIGLRSTKIRTAAKSTLMIIPNSTMANWEIENITRGKKVMVLLYLDFPDILEHREQALVEQVVKESTDALFGIDPGSTNITLFQLEDKLGTRARVTFFILGSSENSLQLRKRLLELASEKISKKLKEYNIEFSMQEPTIYVESPVTI